MTEDQQTLIDTLHMVAGFASQAATEALDGLVDADDATTDQVNELLTTIDRHMATVDGHLVARFAIRGGIVVPLPTRPTLVEDES